MATISRPIRIAAIAVGFAVVFGLFAITGYYYIYYGKLTVGESNYSLAAREAMSGRIPCRDFAYVDMPMAPYLSGALLKIFGFGLAARRALNVVAAGLGLLAIALAMRKRFDSFGPGLAAMFAAAASPQWICLQAQGMNDVWTGLFLAVAFSAAIGGWSFKPRALVFAISASLAVANDLMMLPSTAALAAALAIELENSRKRLAAMAAFVLFLAVFFVFSFLLAGSKLTFFNWTYPWRAEPDSESLIIGFEWWIVSPGAILVLATGLTGVFALVKNRRFAEILLLAAGLLSAIWPVLPKGDSGSSIAPAVPIIAAAGAIALWAVPGAITNHFRHALWILPAVAFIYPLPTLTDDEADRELKEIARVINENASPGPILTPLSIVAVVADRQVLSGTERGVFSVMSEKNSKLAKRLHMTTLAELTNELKKKEPAAVVTMRELPDWNFNWYVPEMKHPPKKLYRKFEKTLKRSYRVVYGSDKMEVMIPKD
jgi:hypothetical protein